MDLGEFAELHVPALEVDDVRFNVQIAVIGSAVQERPQGFRHWSLGSPGHCAVQWPRRAMLLGNLDKAECEKLAQATIQIDYPGVVGPGQTAHWFVQFATATGAQFADPIPQRIHVVSSAPRYPGAPGCARPASSADTPILVEWLIAFHQEVVPHDPPPEQAEIEGAVASGRFMLWTIDGEPVSTAAIARRLRHTGAIAPVYTPPEHRGRGYAGSVTAAVVDQLFAEGKRSVCLYTDLRNPASNRCYAKIGFRPRCDAWHYVHLRRAHTA